MAATVIRSVRLASDADPPRTAAYVLVTIALGVLPVASAWLVKQVLDRTGSALLDRQDAALADGAIVAAVWYVAVLFAGRILEPLASQLNGNLHAQATGHVERRMMEVGGAIPDLDHFERKVFQDEIAFLTSQVSWRPRSVLDHFHDTTRSLLALGGSLVLLWQLQPLLPLALVACAIPQALVEQRLRWRTYQSLTQRSEAARMMVYCASIATQPAAAKEILVFGIGPWFYARWRRLADEAIQEMARLRGAGLRQTLAIVAGNGGVLAVSYAFIADQLGSQRITIGDFALYLSVVLALQQTLATLIRSGGFVYDNAIYMGRLFAFLDDTRPSIAVTPPEHALPAPARLHEGLELRQVTFTYPGQTRPVLRGVTCRLRAGETVALVGENGAGKTTLVKLLTRLYDPSLPLGSAGLGLAGPPGSAQRLGSPASPESSGSPDSPESPGEILLDGVPLAAYDVASLRRRVAVVLQDFAHFALSAQHNVGVGDAPHADDRERVLAAAARTGADTVLAKIAALPQGLDTPLSRQFEGGIDLSGGEWQKIALARSAMRDAALVILDEPTAALDAQAEHDLFQRFRDLATGRTVLLISHRFSTVRMADRILVLEDGRILESGTHDELIALGGRYATLYELQAGRYR